jgi:hypothetical protein
MSFAESTLQPLNTLDSTRLRSAAGELSQLFAAPYMQEHKTAMRPYGILGELALTPFDSAYPELATAQEAMSKGGADIYLVRSVADEAGYVVGIAAIETAVSLRSSLVPLPPRVSLRWPSLTSQETSVQTAKKLTLLMDTRSRDYHPDIMTNIVRQLVATDQNSAFWNITPTATSRRDTAFKRALAYNAFGIQNMGRYIHPNDTSKPPISTLCIRVAPMREA